MGFFKSLLGNSLDELKKNVQDSASSLINSVVGQDSASSLINSVVGNQESDAKTTEDINEPKEPEELFTIEGTTVTFLEGVKRLNSRSMGLFPTNVERIHFCSTLEEINEGDFPAMPDLVMLDFSKAISLTDIEDEAFHDCDKLEVVVLPPNLESVPNFADCSNLVEVHISKETEDIQRIGNFVRQVTVFISCPDAIYDEDFCYNCKQIYLDSDLVSDWRDYCKEDYVHKVRIDALPKGYEYPLRPLEKPLYAKSLIPQTPKQKSEGNNNSSSAHNANISSDRNEDVEAGYNAETKGTMNNKEKNSLCPPPIPEFSYHAIVEGQQRGPYNRDQFKRLVDAGMISAKTMVWCAGMSNWQKAREIEDLEEFFL